jgi:hypothetical protein
MTSNAKLHACATVADRYWLVVVSPSWLGHGRACLRTELRGLYVQADDMFWVHRRIGVLKDRLHQARAHTVREGRYGVSIDHDRADIGPFQPIYDLGDCRFPGAGFTHNRQCFTGDDIKTDIARGMGSNASRSNPLMAKTDSVTTEPPSL